MNKNHEGYHDSTACKAIRAAERRKDKKLRRRKEKQEGLSYRLKELPFFRELRE